MPLFKIDTEGIKTNRVADCLKTFKKHFPNTTLELTYYPPTDADTVIQPRLWSEGISVYQRNGKFYIYFRDLYEHYICTAYLGVNIPLLVEFYLRYHKCKLD